MRPTRVIQFSPFWWAAYVVWERLLHPARIHRNYRIISMRPLSDDG